MKLLILGSFGPYPERVQSFTTDGHEVWYASTEGFFYSEILPNYTPLALGGLGLTLDDAVEQLIQLIKVKRINVVYSLLNVWDGSNKVTAAMLRRGCPVPVVRHYKEHYVSPFEDERICIEQSDGVIFINEESRDYFCGVYRVAPRTICLDADLIPVRYLAGRLRPKLSSSDNQVHLLIAGSVSNDGGRYDYRELIRELTDAGIHVHLYAQFRSLQANGAMWETAGVEESYRMPGCGDYLHIHSPIPPEMFVEEWSQYDAGVLHVPRTDDTFLRQNVPNRYSAYLAAGLPVALPAGKMPAMQRHLEALKAAVVFEEPSELSRLLPDSSATEQAMRVRGEATFEALYPRLIAFLRSCSS